MAIPKKIMKEKVVYVEVSRVKKNMSAKAILKFTTFIWNYRNERLLSGNCVWQDGVKMPSRVSCNFTMFGTGELCNVLWGKHERLFYRVRLIEGEELKRIKLLEEL